MRLRVTGLVLLLLLSGCRLDVAVEEGGSVAAASGKVDCRETVCTAWYGESQPVIETLRATPLPGYRFVGWAGDCRGSAARCELQIGATTADRRVTAHFARGDGVLVELQAAVGGYLRDADGGLDCGLRCARSLAAGNELLLRAVPLSGYALQAWTGACASSAGDECRLQATANVTVGARFVPSDLAPANFDGVYEGALSGGAVALETLLIRNGAIRGSFTRQVQFQLEGSVEPDGSFTLVGQSAVCRLTMAGTISGDSLRGQFDAAACNAGSGDVRAQRVQGLPQSDFVNFESGQVRPLAVSADGERLYAVNTPNNSVEVFAVQGGNLSHLHSVPVGLEPVSVALATESELWVVNHLSDSVSVVDLAPEQPRVSRTLWVGDEPRDIVFAGPGRQRAFITTARRGQNTDYPLAEYRQPGLPRADVWVFDRSSPQYLNGNRALTVVNLFGDVPRALAASPDGRRVYAAIFASGNQTTVVGNSPALVAGKPAPTEDVHGDPQPDTGLVVKWNGTAWVDEAGTDWSERVNLSLPDYDVFTLDAMAAVPREIDRVSGVGTTLFNMAVNPVSGALYVSNTDARNEVRFEGPGTISTSVRGDIARNRLSVIIDGVVQAVPLNPQVDFSVPQGSAIAPAQKALSIAQPTGIAVTRDGASVWLAALGSNKVVSVPTAALEAGQYQPDAARQVAIPGGGPTGLTLSPDSSLLFVLGRYDNAIAVIDVSSHSLRSTVALANPEPAAVREGRRFLYDADATSGNGTASCASCHIFGDVDQLAWDLGNPDDEVVGNPLPFTLTNRPSPGATFHPMKGPMTTQTFRGINDSGPMHWRGDRTGINREVVEGTLESQEAAAFKEFRVAFVGLLGRANDLPEDELQRFTDFALTLTPPPNPLRALDNSLLPSQQLGEQIYFNEVTTGGALRCNDCHTLNPLLNQFGTGGLVNDEGQGIDEDFKVPHFRNLYTKVGMFGLPANEVIDGRDFMGDQVRGFGYLHDGSIDTLDHFFSAGQFNLLNSDQRRFAVIDFAMASDSNLAPIVGSQATLDGSVRYLAGSQRLAVMLQRALADSDRPECDLVAQGVIDGSPRGALLRRDGFFHTDSVADAPLTLAQITAMAKQPGQALTFSCVPPGSGVRIALDADRDGVRNADESP